MKYTINDVTIEKQIIKIKNNTINASKIGNINIVKCPRYPITNYIKEWLQLFVIDVIVCNIWPNLEIIGTIYLFTIIPLVLYNINEFRKTYYTLELQISNDPLKVWSRDEKALAILKQKIEEAMFLSSELSTINIEQGLINDGIINIGNQNINEVKK